MFLSDPRDVDVTFGTPGDNAPFSFSLHDIFEQAGKAGEIGAIDWRQVMDTTEATRRGIVAAERQTRLVDTINAHESALREAAENRIVTVRQQTGIEIENPFDGGYELDARDRLGLPLTGVSPDDLARLPAMQRDIFNEKIDEAAQAHPDKAAALTFYQSLEDQAQAIGRSASQGAGDVSLPAALIGGLWGSRRDPLFLGSLFAGPELSTARTVLGRIGWGAIKQGLFNAGLQAAAQPAVQDWRRTIGERNGVVPALEDVGMAFLFGAIPGAAIEGVRALNAGQKAAIGRVLDGTGSPEDVRTAADAVNAQLGDNVEREIRTGAADEANDRAAAAGPPSDVPAGQHSDILAQAVRHADDPDSNPPPDIPVTTAPRSPDHERLIDEALPAKIGDSTTVDGKPVSFARFSPTGLTTDAAAFQYKGGGDAAGVTDRLRNVSEWDPLASGKTLVFERADGTRVIADGHQRLGLAKRLGQSDESVRLDGYLFREVDGWTPEDVRAIAAKKNMQEGSGDALDAARVLRDRPDLLDGSLPVTSPMMKNAVALARLSDEAFGMAINGVVPPNYAAAVGSMVADKLQHASVLADLVRFAPETEREARMLIGEIIAAGFRPEEQISLFGAAETTRSLMGERVKVLDAALVGLARDKKLFGTLAAKADAIEAAGNQLARSTNDARAQDAAALQDLLTRLARRTGPVSDALNRAAAQMADGMKPARAADGFLDEVRNLLDRDGLTGLLADPQLKPAVTVEPGTPEALANAEGALASRTTEAAPEPPQSHPEASEPSLFDSVAVATRDDGRDVRFISREDALAEAEKPGEYADLVAACKG